MKQKLLELIKNKPKHFSKMIKSDSKLREWIEQNSLIKSENFSAMVYSAINQESNICQYGNEKKYSNIKDGFIGCGPAALCRCTRESVSKNVSDTKSKYTEVQRTKINDKRRQTNLEKYGVTCVAQTEENRQKFKDWYADPDNVQKNLERIRQTNLEKYGVENCKSLPEVEEKIIATCLAKYGVRNVAQIPSTKAKLRARTAEYKLSGHLIKKGFSRFKNYIESNYDFSLLTTELEYRGVESKQKILIECNNCHSQQTISFYYNKDLYCEICNPRKPKFTSNEEQEIFDFITVELGIQGGIQGDKRLINPYEIDMLFHAEKIAIEYCGLYWHSEASAGKTKDYHQNKMKLVNQLGYKLITIFSDEWNYKREIVKSKLANIFKKTSTKHYARKLQVRLVDAESSKEFLDKHHLQGSSSSKINLGLYTNDTLLALMTFSNGRAALNTKAKNDEYELVRFVTNGDSIVGGAGKLLSYFVKNYNPKKIISYADNRWSQGNLYKTLGFIEEEKYAIGYWYVDDYKQRLHRFNFTKSQLVKLGHDPRKTEWEIMRDLGYDRIWDCGHRKYVMEISE